MTEMRTCVGICGRALRAPAQCVPVNKYQAYESHFPRLLHKTFNQAIPLDAARMVPMQIEVPF